MVQLAFPMPDERLRSPAPKVTRLLEDAAEDLLGFYAFPAEHWPKLRSTNPLERMNREVGRRSDVVGIYPNDAALIRLAGMLLIEQNDEWLVGRTPLPRGKCPGFRRLLRLAPPTSATSPLLRGRLPLRL